MGGYSLVNAEMILLRKATEVGHYNHYHLLSGQDLPIQSQETIQKFFLKNSDKEFVGFDKIFLHMVIEYIIDISFKS